jgi:hypothetical protein
MKAEFKGASGASGGNWSTASAWVGGNVPTSSERLHIKLDAQSTEDLGSASAPFLTNDIIGASAGLTPLTLNVAGFLHARDVKDLAALLTDGSGSITVRNIENVNDLTMIGTHAVLNVEHNIVNVPQFTDTEESVTHVGGSLVNVQTFAASFGGTMQVEHSVGTTQFTLGGIGSGNLILDHPEHRHLTNPITLAGNGDTIELGGLVFDKADFLPNSPGSSSGTVQLSEQGRPVYQLTDVTLRDTGTFSVGIDKSTGYHEIVFSQM